MKRGLIVAPYPIFPTIAGGKIRIAALARGLAAREISVDILTPFAFGRRRAVAPDFPCRVIQFPYPFVWALLTDRPFPFQYLTSFHPGLRFLIKAYLKGYHFIVFAHVQFAALLPLIPPSTEVIYDAQNVEYDYVRGECHRLPPVLSELVCRRIGKLERAMVDRAEQILLVSEEDGERFKDLYSCDGEKFFLVPNGVKDQIRVGCSERLWSRFPDFQRYEQVTVFSGSDVAHNRLAVEHLFHHLGAHLGDGLALVLNGEVTRGYLKKGTPEHVFLDPDGAVEDYGSIHAVGLNPVTVGGGTNLKLSHYLRSGLRVVTTPFGLRGLTRFEPYTYVAELADFWKALNSEIPDPPRDETVWHGVRWCDIADRLATHLTRGRPATANAEAQ